MAAQSIAQFVAETADKAQAGSLFEVESTYFLQVNLASSHVWIKVGAMVAYVGEIGFEREGAFDRGVGDFLKKTFTGEGARLTKAAGTGALYLADRGKRITLLTIENESLVVNGEDLLSVQDGVQCDVTMMRKISAPRAGCSTCA